MIRPWCAAAPARNAGRTPSAGPSPSAITRSPAGPRSRRSPWNPAEYQVPEVEGKTRFLDLGLPEELIHAIADLEFRYCTPIQAKSLPLSLDGANVCGRAQTGTGKTAAFLLTIFKQLMEKPAAPDRRKGLSTSAHHGPHARVVHADRPRCGRSGQVHGLAHVGRLWRHGHAGPALHPAREARGCRRGHTGPPAGLPPAAGRRFLEGGNPRHRRGRPDAGHGIHSGHEAHRLWLSAEGRPARRCCSAPR